MYLHIFTDNQLIPAIVNHCEEVSADNRYVVFAKSSRFPVVAKLEFYPSYKMFKKDGFDIKKYKRVFIHYLGGNAVDLVLDNPDYPEFYWFFWGADGYAMVSDSVNVHLPKTRALSRVHKSLYLKIKTELLRIFTHSKARKRKALQSIKTCCTYVTGDVALIRKYVSPRMNVIFFAYLSTDELFNVKGEFGLNLDFTNRITVQVGNSLNATNNHIEAIDFLEMIDQEKKMNVVMPVSYGGHEGYKKALKAYAKDHLGSVSFIDRFLPYDEYVKMLQKMDIAVFFHIRQQGSNNALALLWLGKIVIMREESTLFAIFKSWGLSVIGQTEVQSIADIIDFNSRTPNRLEENRRILLQLFSPEATKLCYRSIYE